MKARTLLTVASWVGFSITGACRGTAADPPTHAEATLAPLLDADGRPAPGNVMTKADPTPPPPPDAGRPVK